MYKITAHSLIELYLKGWIDGSQNREPTMDEGEIVEWIMGFNNGIKIETNK